MPGTRSTILATALSAGLIATLWHLRAGPSRSVPPADVGTGARVDRPADPIGSSRPATSADTAELTAACGRFDAWATAYVAERSTTMPAIDEAVASGSPAPAAEPAASTPRPAPRVDAAATATAEAPSLDQGRALAAARRSAMRQLIERDPRTAIAEAVPYAVRRALPADIRAGLEQPVSARGDLQVAVALSDDRSAPSIVQRRVTIGDTSYDAHVYGWRSTEISRHDIPIQGVALDGHLAVDESSVRLLSAEEIADAGLAKTTATAVCPVSGAPASADVIALIGGQTHPLCSAGHISALEAGIRAAQGGGTAAGTVASAPPTSWTTGPKRVLVIRVDTADDPGESVSSDRVVQVMGDVDAFFRVNSYGKTSLSATCTPVIRLPQTSDWYRNHDVYAVRADAWTASAAAGYDPLSYDLEIVTYRDLGGSAGLGYVGGRGVWAAEWSFRVVAHELGHNYGLWHANAWVPSDGTPNGAGSHREYGEPYDTMGGWGEPANHFNAYEKNLLGWLDDARVQNVTSSGLYHILPHDQTGSGVAAVKVHENNGRDYWFSTRGLRPGGVFVNWYFFGIEGSGSELLDMTPGSSGDMGDAAMTPGLALRDSSPPVTVSTVALYGDGSADVRVDFGDTPPNHPPVARLGTSALTGTAPLTVNFDASGSTDSDGRIVSYAWSFGDGSSASDGQYASHSYATGSYVATVTVTDNGGATASASVQITVTDGTVVTGDGTGLLGEYWSNHSDFSGAATVSRTDATVDFDWGGGSPDGNVSSDWFTARWSGWIQAPTSGTYTFTTTSDDGIRLWIGGQLVVDAWYPQSPNDHSGTVTLRAGEKVDIRMEYFEQGGGAVARLWWAAPDRDRVIVPRSALYPASGGGGDGSGLAGQYWSGQEGFDGAPTLTRTDATVDFDWGYGSPDPTVSSDSFSARWSGQVQAPTTDTYTFTVTGDDGIRLWVDGVLVVDAWYLQSPTDHSGTVALTAGRKVDIRLEYYEHTGGAVVRLGWSTGGGANAIVPRSALFPAASAAAELAAPAGNG